MDLSLDEYARQLNEQVFSSEPSVSGGNAGANKQKNKQYQNAGGVKNRLGAKGGTMQKPVAVARVGAGNAANKQSFKVTAGGNTAMQARQKTFVKTGGVKNRLGINTATLRSPVSAPGLKTTNIRTLGNAQNRLGLKGTNAQKLGAAKNRLGARPGQAGIVQSANMGNTTFKVTGLANAGFDVRQKLQTGQANQTFDMRQKLQKSVPNIKVQTVMPQSGGTSGPFDARLRLGQNAPKVDARQTLNAKHVTGGLPTVKVVNELAQNPAPQNRPVPAQGTQVMVTGLGRRMVKGGVGVKNTSGGLVKTFKNKPVIKPITPPGGGSMRSDTMRPQSAPPRGNLKITTTNKLAHLQQRPPPKKITPISFDESMADEAPSRLKPPPVISPPEAPSRLRPAPAKLAANKIRTSRTTRPQSAPGQATVSQTVTGTKRSPALVARQQSVIRQQSAARQSARQQLVMTRRQVPLKVQPSVPRGVGTVIQRYQAEEEEAMEELYAPIYQEYEEAEEAEIEYVTPPHRTTLTAPVRPSPARPQQVVYQPVLKQKIYRQPQPVITEEEYIPVQQVPVSDVVSPTHGVMIRISNLHPMVTEDDIVELFGAVGSLKKARLVRPGTAEVSFTQRDEATAAIRKYHNRDLDGQPMQVRMVTGGSSELRPALSRRLAPAVRRSPSPTPQMSAPLRFASSRVSPPRGDDREEQEDAAATAAAAAITAFTAAGPLRLGKPSTSEEPKLSPSGSAIDASLVHKALFKSSRVEEPRSRPVSFTVKI